MASMRSGHLCCVLRLLAGMLRGFLLSSSQGRGEIIACDSELFEGTPVNTPGGTSAEGSSTYFWVPLRSQKLLKNTKVNLQIRGDLLPPGIKAASLQVVSPVSEASDYGVVEGLCGVEHA